MGPRDEVEEAGERIERAVEALGRIEDHRVRELAEDALRVVVGLYGEALGRTVDVLGQRWPDALRAVAADDLVASLLVVHDLHPEPVTDRVLRALDDVRPYLGSHGGDVELVGVEDGVVRLRLLGSCDGCASSSVTLKLAVEGAVTAAAPEVVDIQVEDPTPRGSDGPLIAPASLFERPDGFGDLAPGTATGGAPGGVGAGPTWARVERGDLPTPSAVSRTRAGDVEVALARTAAGLYAYLDACSGCAGAVSGASLDGAVLACATCGARFDVEAAGRRVDGTPGHLDPLPLLHRDGEVELAVPAGASS